MIQSQRLFIGIDLPSACKASLRELDPELPGLRWLPEHQLHLTLSFLGEVPSSQVEPLSENLRTVSVPEFILPMQGIGSFNARGRPSVVWVGVGHGHPHLFALHKRIQDAVLHTGLEPDLKPFHPHITVARARGISREALRPFLRTNRETDLGLFRVSEFILFASDLSAEGAEHTALLRVSLPASA